MRGISSRVLNLSDMKKFIIIAALAVIAATTVTFVVGTKKAGAGLEMIFTESVEALASSEGGAVVTCRCGSFLGRGSKASNGGDTCAGGENAHCWDYDGNC